jgi:hypothetical protein
MSLHDTYARLTPFDVLFARDEDAESLWAAVREEAEGRGVDVRDPAAFVTLGSVTDFIRRVEGEESPEESILQYGALAFQALHQGRVEASTFLLTTHAARYLVEGSPDAAPDPPTDAGYLQLPRHLFWLEDGSEVPQSVDGIAWTVAPEARGGGALLHALAVTAVRPDRRGLGVVPLPEAPLADAPAWLEVDARGDGSDFHTSMPGAEIDGLYAFATAGEVLKLLARFFSYASAVPGALREEVAAGSRERPGEEESDGPARSRLPWIRVNLEE